MIYFDNAATTYIKPKPVIDAVVNAMQGMGNAGRGVNTASLDASRSIYNTRVKLAEFFGSDYPAGVIFTANATDGLNIAIKGLINPCDHVITSVMEHNSVLRPLYELSEKGCEVDYVEVDKKGVIDPKSFEKYIKDNTKAIIVNHASNLTGNLTDIEKVGEIAKANNLIFIVDASQTAGVFPINVKSMNIDCLVFTGHKSLMAPQGIGGMIVREGLDIRPLKSGGTGVQTYNKKQPEDMPTRLEAGTLNGHGIAGLSAAIDYINETGIENIRNKEKELTEYFYDEITKIGDITVYGDFSSFERAPIVSINISDFDSAYVGDTLFNDYRISIRSGGHCAPLAHKALGTVETGAVRFSFSHYNTKEEVDETIKAIKEICYENS